MNIIINGDDFGLTESKSLAILEAFNKGYISSTTMCANGDYFDKAIELAKRNNLNNKIGIHINLTEGEPLTNKIKDDSFFCINKKFHNKINRYKPLNYKQKQEVYDEVKAQIERMRKNGLIITHADSHHHIHTGIFFAPTIVKVLKQYNIKKIRIHRNIGKIKTIKIIIKKTYNLWLTINRFTTVNYFGDMSDLKNWHSLKSEKTLEIMTHPDFGEDGKLIDITNCIRKPNGEPLIEVLQQVKSNTICSYYEI